MAFSASLIEISLRYTMVGQRCQTARCYTWDGAVIAAATPEQVGEAWWNHYKDAWRSAAYPGPTNALFQSVFVREVGGGLAYGEFAIPTGEQQGTRADSDPGNVLPAYCSVGVRLTVASGETRPGQFRLGFMVAADLAGNNVSSTFQEYAADLGDLYSGGQIMGAPIATGVLFPQVVRFGADNNTVLANQDIVGFVVNPLATSQVSRRINHGS